MFVGLGIGIGSLFFYCQSVIVHSLITSTELAGDGHDFCIFLSNGFKLSVQNAIACKNKRSSSSHSLCARMLIDSFPSK